MNFWHFVRVVRARWRMIAAVVAVTLIVIIVAAPKPKVIYEASVYMQPTQQVMTGGISTSTSNAQGQSQERGVILSNLIVLARSGVVFDDALWYLAQDQQDQINLEYQSKREFLQAKSDFLKKTEDERKQEREIEPKTPPLGRYRQQYQKIHVKNDITIEDWVNDVLEVTPVYNAVVGKEGTTTDVIRITVRMQDGYLVPFLANAAGWAFQQAYKERSREDMRNYIEFLKGSQGESKARLHDLQSQIAQHKSKSDVVAVDAETQSSLASLASLQGDQTRAEASVREADAALRDIDAQLKVQPTVTKQPLPGEMNPVVTKLNEDLAKAESDMVLIERRYKPAHPTYQAAQARISHLKQRIAKETSDYAPASINDIRHTLLKQRSEVLFQLATAKARLASVNASLVRAKSRIDNLTKAEPRLTELMRDYAQEAESYRLISDKLALTRIAEKETTKTGSISFLSRAPSRAFGPIVQGQTKKVLLIYGFFLSLVLGVALAVWLDSIDNRMRNAADVEKLLELPVMGLTPKLTGGGGVLPKLTHMYPLSAMAESYKILRTNILFAMRDNPFKTLMVATGRPGQGATTTVCNLAIALAQIGKRIILIDADMRRPSLHKFFEVPNEAGLSTLLQGKGNLTDAFQTTNIENLILIPAGPQPFNPSELIGSEKMRDLVEKLEEHCDLVLFDTPSTIVFSDGPMLASWIDAVLMVVSANQAPRGTETVTRDLLRRAKANILGVVVNRMSPENVDSCFYYSHYYSDSAAKPAHPELESGNGDKPDSDKGASVAKSEPKAIPAAAGEPGEATEDESPFPD